MKIPKRGSHYFWVREHGKKTYQLQVGEFDQCDNCGEATQINVSGLYKSEENDVKAKKTTLKLEKINSIWANDSGNGPDIYCDSCAESIGTNRG
jgi:hypothetical protein